MLFLQFMSLWENMAVPRYENLCSISRSQKKELIFITVLNNYLFKVMSRVTKFQFTQEDLDEQVDSVFNRLDQNGDGVVTIEEFIDCCQTVNI